MSIASYNKIPAWSWIAPLAASALLALSYAHVLPAESGLTALMALALLGAAVFAAVHHAEVLALKLGEPMGSILLAVAVTAIEIGLILAIMLADKAGAETVARDAVFAAVMIVLNGVVGLCLVLGAGRHFEQEFQLKGASAALAVLGTLATITLVLPNHTLAVEGPRYSHAQLVVVGLLSLALYGIFVFVQTVRHRDYFLASELAEGHDLDDNAKPTNRIAVITLGLLALSLTTVVLIAKTLTPSLDGAILALKLPQAFVGVVIAGIVLLPEGIASVKAARLNRLQNSINLGLGSAIASIGLTIPAVAILSIIFDKDLVLGINAESTVLLVLTLFMSALTLGTGRTTVLQGAVHLVIFLIFLLVSAIP
jgi:Ca2+:H+ antiporter